jgi:hypothetical protein
MEFGPDDEAMARVLANRFTELNLKHQKLLVEKYNTPRNMELGARWPMESVLLALEELNLDSRVRQKLAEKPDAQPKPACPVLHPGNTLKAKQVKDILCAALKETQDHIRQNEQSCKELDNFLRAIAVT